MAQIILNVPDITCGHCEMTVREALSPLEGIRDVSVSIPDAQVLVEYDDSKIQVDQMKDVLEAEEYPVESVQPV